MEDGPKDAEQSLTFSFSATSLLPSLFPSLSPFFPLCLPFRLLQVEGDIAELIQDFRYESEDLLLCEGAAEGGQWPSNVLQAEEATPRAWSSPAVCKIAVLAKDDLTQ